MDYFDNIKNAILFIEENLKEDINVEDIAKEGFYSPYHFMRVFMQVTGDSPGAYLRKRRLTEASLEIIHGKPIIEVALDYHFNSQEAFTRSFKNQFNVTPGSIKKNGINGVEIFKPKLNNYFIILNGGRKMFKEPKIEDLNEIKLIGYPYYGINTRIPEMWERFMKYYPQYEKHEKKYGYMFNFGHNKEPWEFFYMPAVEVKTLDKDMPFELVGKIVPASKWAMFQTSIKDIGSVLNFINNEWLPNSKYKRSLCAEMEIYPKNCDEEGILYCISVVEK